MKKTIVSLLIIGSMWSCKEAIKDEASNQTSAIPATVLPAVEGDIFNTVDENPEFPGGVSEMYKYIGENIKYPEKAQKEKIEGKVFVKFVVTKDGRIGDIKTLKGIGFGCDEEVTRIIASMPTWKPGKNNGKEVNVYYTMPVNFRLE